MTASAADAPLASQGRRLAGAVLDIALFVLTLGLGWVVWYLVAARNGQSPAKRLLGTRVIREDDSVATLGWMLIRDLAVRVIAFGAVDRLLVAALGEGTGGALTSLLFIVAALWCVWDARHQCLGDKVVRTRAVYGRARAASPPLALLAYTCSHNDRNLAVP